MTYLPNAADAALDDEKITKYLLEPAHSTNAAAKAGFFMSFGFTQQNSEDLKKALLDHPLNNAVASHAANPYGEKYVVSCSINSPDGRNPCVVSVWIIEPPDPTPRFVTAYPGP